eukprot:43772-Amphidinium_carterae.1
MTREERKQVLGEVLGELDEEMRRIWEPVLTPMGNLLWVNTIEKYSQFRTPRFVHCGLKASPLLSGKKLFRCRNPSFGSGGVYQEKEVHWRNRKTAGIFEMFFVSKSRPSSMLQLRLFARNCRLAVGRTAAHSSFNDLQGVVLEQDPGHPEDFLVG